MQQCGVKALTPCLMFNYLSQLTVADHSKGRGYYWEKLVGVRNRYPGTPQKVWECFVHVRAHNMHKCACTSHILGYWVTHINISVKWSWIFTKSSPYVNIGHRQLKCPKRVWMFFLFNSLGNWNFKLEYKWTFSVPIPKVRLSG
jgi:hypothetical protein